MPLGSLLCALWAACVAGRRNCSVGFWSAGTSPSPTHLWSPRFHTRARGAGLPHFVVMCRPWLQAIHACTIRGLCLGVVVVCRSDRPSTCQTSTAQPYMQCLLVATFFCRLHLRCIAWSVLVSTCSCMQHLLVHIFLGHAVDMHGGGSVLFSCLKTRRLRNSISWSVQMLHFVLCAALSQLSTELTAEGYHVVAPRIVAVWLVASYGPLYLFVAAFCLASAWCRAGSSMLCMQCCNRRYVLFCVCLFVCAAVYRLTGWASRPDSK